MIPPQVLLKTSVATKGQAAPLGESSSRSAQPRFDDITVILPTLNEAFTIGELLRRLSQLYPGVRLLVVDDCSQDGTAEVVRRVASEAEPRQVTFISRVNRAPGLCASVLDGIVACSTPFFVVMDADFQHPPEHIGRLISSLRSGAVLSLGAREDPGRGLSLLRLCMTRLATLGSQLFLWFRGVRCHDPLSGLFGGDTSMIRDVVVDNRVRFELSGYKVLFDLLRLVPSSWPLETVFYPFNPRALGRSKLRWVHGWYFFRSFFSSRR